MKKIILTVASLGVLFFAGCKETEENPKVSLANYNLTENSKIQWKGKAADGNFNEGTIKVEGTVKAEMLNSGGLKGIFSAELTVPVSSIDVTNLPPNLKPVLESHLKTADFFYMVLHPNVSFKIISGEAIDGDVDDLYLIKGEMTLLGQTHPLEFPAKITLNNTSLNVKASLAFNQSLWGMNYHLDESYPEHDRLVAGIDLNFNINAEKAVQSAN